MHDCLHTLLTYVIGLQVHLHVASKHSEWVIGGVGVGGFEGCRPRIILRGVCFRLLSSLMQATCYLLWRVAWQSSSW